MGVNIDRIRANFPPVLLRASNWVSWSYERDARGKDTKVPYGAHGRGKASTTNPATWGTFDQAAKRATLDKRDGVGYVFAGPALDEDNAAIVRGLCGIDLDHCRDARTGAIDEWARAILARFDTYAEVSPSGTGVHIILAGRLPDSARHKRPYATGGIEVYDRERFFTVTGDAL
jgi:putative DNA primase/helicase